MSTWFVIMYLRFYKLGRYMMDWLCTFLCHSFNPNGQACQDKLFAVPLQSMGQNPIDTYLGRYVYCCLSVTPNKQVLYIHTSPARSDPSSYVPTRYVQIHG